jgi:hypothetical protein
VKKWAWNLWKMQGKWWNGESSVLLNLLFHCTHQIFINYRRSTAPHPLNHSWHVLHTPHKVDDECEPVSCFLHSRNGLQAAFHMWRASCFSWTFQTHTTMRKHSSIVCKLRPCLPKGPTNSACMNNIMTAALQRQYLQTEFILWIRLIQSWVCTKWKLYISAFVNCK